MLLFYTFTYLLKLSLFKFWISTNENAESLHLIQCRFVKNPGGFFVVFFTGLVLIIYFNSLHFSELHFSCFYIQKSQAWNLCICMYLVGLWIWRTVPSASSSDGWWSCFSTLRVNFCFWSDLIGRWLEKTIVMFKLWSKELAYQRGYAKLI